MPVHDWTQVDAGIFHAFHHDWITDLARALNSGILPEDYYALPEQFAAGVGPDVLTLQGSRADENGSTGSGAQGGSTGLLVSPKLEVTAETDLEFYRRKQTPLVVRHVSGDRVVAMIEIVSPGNKSTRHAIRAFVEKAGDMLERRVHLLIIDLFPPGPRDPHGIHAAIWDQIAGKQYLPPANKPLTFAAYESGSTVRAYVRPGAVGDSIPDMPLFLEPNGSVQTPLEATYQTAFAAMPRRWRLVLDPQA